MSYQITCPDGRAYLVTPPTDVTREELDAVNKAVTAFEHSLSPAPNRPTLPEVPPGWTIEATK